MLPVAPEFEEKKEKSPKSPKKLYWTIGALVGVVLVLGIAYLVKSRTVSADIASSGYQPTIEFSGFPKDIKSGDQVLATVTVSNNTGKNIPDGYLLVASQGADLKATVKLVQNLSQTDPGYLRELRPDEEAFFASDDNPGFYWYIGPLGSKQTKSQQIKATISGTVQSDFKIEAKYFLPKYQNVACGTLGLSKCNQLVSQTQIGYESFQEKLSDQAKIKLRAGYNYISLPYVFTQGSLNEFFASLKDKWAYYYRTDLAQYADLEKEENQAFIKPGAGFWVFDSAGGEYSLPQGRVETDISQSYNVNLGIGWNQIGNPYPKRVILSSEKILVREIADDGSLTGTVYSLKSAIDSGVLSVPYIIIYKSFTDSSGNQNDFANLLQYQVLPLESTLNPFSGLTINSTKKVALIFPGTSVIAPGDLLSAQEKNAIENWIIRNGLNQYGDTQDTVYTGGTPLVDSATGATIDRFDYIVSKHPDRPWNKN